MRSSKRQPDIAVHYSPELPNGSTGQVHLWLFDLDGEHGKAAPLSLISADELAIAGRLRDRTLRARKLRRFAISRLVLAGVLEANPSDFDYAYGACGKPRVSGPGRGIGFSVSQSANIMALAVGFAVDVGVDVEVVDLAKGRLEFYRTWTLQEASMKLFGIGFATKAPSTPHRPHLSKSLEISFEGKDLMVSVATAERTGRPDPYQGILPEEDPGL